MAQGNGGSLTELTQRPCKGPGRVTRPLPRDYLIEISLHSERLGMGVPSCLSLLNAAPSFFFLLEKPRIPGYEVQAALQAASGRPRGGDHSVFSLEKVCCLYTARV